jgi:hypothetical protein
VRIGCDFYPACGIVARLVVQAVIGPLDRVFEASREEMSDRKSDALRKPSGSNGLKRSARSHASIAGLDWLCNAWMLPLAIQALVTLAWARPALWRSQLSGEEACSNLSQHTTGSTTYQAALIAGLCISAQIGWQNPVPRSGRRGR